MTTEQISLERERFKTTLLSMGFAPNHFENWNGHTDTLFKVWLASIQSRQEEKLKDAIATSDKGEL